MTIEELEELVRKRKEEVSVIPKKDDAYPFIKKFTENNKCSKITEYIDIDVFELITCLYYLNNSNLSYEKCRGKIAAISPILKRLSSEELDDLFDVVMDIRAEGNLDNIIEIIEKKKFFRFNKLSKIDKNKIRFILSLSNFENGFEDVINFCKFIRDEDKESRLLIELVITQKEMIDEIDNLISQLDNLPINVRDKYRKRIFEMGVKNMFCTDIIMREVSRPFNYVIDTEVNEEKNKKNSQRIIIGLDKSLDLLKKNAESEEITHVREIIKGIKDDNIKLEFLKYIYEHNMAYYERLKKESIKLNDDTEAKYQAVFQDYKIIINKALLKDVSKYEIDDLKFILEFLKNLNLDDNKILAILKNTNRSIIDVIKKHHNDGILSDDFISYNLDVLLCDSPKFNLIDGNMNIFGRYGISPLMLKDEILLIDSKLLENNLELLKTYDLIKFFKTTNDYSFLRDSDLAFKIDRLLELGYEFFLEHNLGLINMDKINRLDVLKVLNIPIDSIKELIEILTSKKFIVNDSEIEDYILDVLPYKKLELDDSTGLERFENTSRTLKIGDCLISSLKVKRLLKEGNNLYDSLTFGCRFSNDEFESFKNDLKGLEKVNK